MVKKLSDMFNPGLNDSIYLLGTKINNIQVKQKIYKAKEVSEFN